MNRLRSYLLVPMLVFLGACGDGTTDPITNEEVAGTYHATTAVGTPTGGQPFDALALGVVVDLVLTPLGTTSGTLVIPAVLTEDGVDDDVIDLAGTYTIAGNTLTFHGQGDSFIPESTWTIGNGTLTTTDTQPEGTFEVTLTRS
jgi:hypothetical protein